MRPGPRGTGFCSGVAAWEGRGISEAAEVLSEPDETSSRCGTLRRIGQFEPQGRKRLNAVLHTSMGSKEVPAVTATSSFPPSYTPRPSSPFCSPSPTVPSHSSAPSATPHGPPSTSPCMSSRNPPYSVHRRPGTPSPPTAYRVVPILDFDSLNALTKAFPAGSPFRPAYHQSRKAGDMVFSRKFMVSSHFAGKMGSTGAK